MIEMSCESFIDFYNSIIRSNYELLLTVNYTNDYAMESRVLKISEGESIKYGLYNFYIDKESFFEHIIKEHGYASLNLGEFEGENDRILSKREKKKTKKANPIESLNCGNRPAMSIYKMNPNDLANLVKRKMKVYLQDKGNLKSFIKFINSGESKSYSFILPVKKEDIGVVYKVKDKHVVGNPHKIKFLEVIVQVTHRDSDVFIYLKTMIGHSQSNLKD